MDLTENIPAADISACCSRSEQRSASPPAHLQKAGELGGSWPAPRKLQGPTGSPRLGQAAASRPQLGWLQERLFFLRGGSCTQSLLLLHKFMLCCLAWEKRFLLIKVICWSLSPWAEKLKNTFSFPSDYFPGLQKHRTTLSIALDGDAICNA